MIDSNPRAARELVKQTSQGLKGISGFFDLFLFASFIMTYVENILFYFYIIYIPYLIVMKAVQLAMKIAFYGALTLLIVTCLADKWSLKIDDVFDEQTQELVQREGEKVAITVLGLSKQLMMAAG